MKGFVSDKNDTCTDIDECQVKAPCDANAVCNNLPGGYECSCSAGFHGDGKTCYDGDCSDENCPMNEECSTPRTSDCKCQAGLPISMVKFHGD